MWALSELERLYAATAPRFGLDRHPQPCITVQPGDGATPCWDRTGRAPGVDEIAIAAETLNRPLDEVVTTLLHEMVHHACRWEGITDVSGKGDYHNAHFRRRAEAAGMVPGEKHGYRGWNDVRPGQELRTMVNALKLDPNAFGLARIERKGTVRPAVSKWTCGCGRKQTIWWQRKEPLYAICVFCAQKTLSYELQTALFDALPDIRFKPEPAKPTSDDEPGDALTQPT